MLISNPLASPLLVPVAGTVGGLFAGALLALFVAARGQWDALRTSILFARWRTWVLIAPIYTLAVLAGPLPITLLAASLAAQGVREYARLTRLGAPDRSILLAGAVALPTIALLGGIGLLYPTLVLFALAATLPPLLAQDVEHGARRSASSIFGLFSLPVALTHLGLISSHPSGGPGLLLVLGLAIALSDIGAFTAGKVLGRHPLAPRLSPGKTWEGVIGNLVGAGFGVLLLSSLLPPALPAFSVCLVVAAGAVWGDLLESLLKRTAEAKDSGDWLPGFGGLLDRVDSILFAAPAAFYFFRLFLSG
jgi:phosphatidate cytidylyltransferase